MDGTRNQSAVADPAIEKLFPVDTIFEDQLFSLLSCGGGLGRTEAVIFGAVTHELFRMRVAVEAPPHLQGVSPAHERHLVDAAMTTLAADSLCDVDAVVEVHEIRQIMNAGPFQWLTGAEALAHRCEHRAVAPDQGMATHTDFGRRDSRECGYFDRRVAIPAVDPQAPHMMLVAERDRLNADDVGFGHVRRAIHSIPGECRRRQ